MGRAHTIYTPAAALLAAREVQWYQPPQAAPGPWMVRIMHLLGIACLGQARSQMPSQRIRERSHLPTPSELPPCPRGGESNQRHEHHVHGDEVRHLVASSPDQGGNHRQVAHHPVEDARVPIERRRER